MLILGRAHANMHAYRSLTHAKKPRCLETAAGRGTGTHRTLGRKRYGVSGRVRLRAPRRNV